MFQILFHNVCSKIHRIKKTQTQKHTQIPERHIQTPTKTHRNTKKTRKNIEKNIHKHPKRHTQTAALIRLEHSLICLLYVGVRVAINLIISHLLYLFMCFVFMCFVFMGFVFTWFAFRCFNFSCIHISRLLPKILWVVIKTSRST